MSENRERVSLVPYLAAWGASLSALLAAATVLPWPLFSIGLLLVNTVAIPASMWMRSCGVDKNKASVLAVLLGVLFLLPYLRLLPLLAAVVARPLVLSPYQVLQFIVASFSFFLAFRNFSLITDFDLTATVVPATAILLLVAILSPGMHFAAFLLPAMLSFTILFSHEHRRLLAFEALEVGPPNEKRKPSEESWGRAKGPAFVGAASMVIALLLAQFEVRFNLVPLIPLDFQIKISEFISSFLVRAGRRVYGHIEPVIDLASDPTHLTSKVLFIVKAEEPAYWRGTSFEVYNGRWWMRPSTERRRIWVEEGRAYLPPMDKAVREGKFRLLRQEVKLERPLKGGLFSAYEPWMVEVPGARRFSVKPDGTVNFSVILWPGEVYKVISRVPVRTLKELKQAPKEISPKIAEVYLQLPPDLPRRVCELARKVAGAAPDWFEAARRVERFLEKNFEATLEKQRAPWGRNFVDYFLFESKRGFCVHFASAMAVMLRCLGIPARVAAGFAPGVYDKALKGFIVRENDAHAWVEVYFPGCGWVTFDPTPEEAIGGPRGLRARLGLLLFSAGQVLRRWGLGLKKWATGLPWKALIVAFLPALAIALIGWQLSKRGLLWLPRMGERLRSIPQWGADPAIEAYRAMLRLLERARLGRRPHETPFEHLSRVEPEIGDAASHAHELAKFYVERVYGERLARLPEVERAFEGLRGSFKHRRV